MYCFVLFWTLKWRSIFQHCSQTNFQKQPQNAITKSAIDLDTIIKKRGGGGECELPWMCEPGTDLCCRLRMMNVTGKRSAYRSQLCSVVSCNQPNLPVWRFANAICLSQTSRDPPSLSVLDLFLIKKPGVLEKGWGWGGVG